MEGRFVKPGGRGFFLLDTKGHCFLCWRKPEELELECVVGGSPPPPVFKSYYPLRHLSGYLKIGKEVTGNTVEAPNPPPLSSSGKAKEVPEVDSTKCNWAVPLCDSCSKVNEDFVIIKRQLELAELEMANCLQRMHQKLAKSAVASQEETIVNGAVDETPFLRGLRQDVMQKCSLKICGLIQPSYHQDPFPMDDRGEKDNKLNLKCGGTRRRTTRPGPPVEKKAQQSKQPDLSLKEVSHSDMEELELDPVKDQCLPEEDKDDQDFIPEPEDDADDDQEMDIDSLSSLSEGETDPDTDATSSIPKKRKLKLNNGEDEAVGAEHLLKIFLNPSLSSSDDPKKKTIDPLTGYLKCGLCQEEFKNYGTFKYHYNSVHLQVRFKCRLCGKEFVQQIGFRLHYQRAHQGATFQCDKCGKEFALKSSLVRHANKPSCWKGAELTSVIRKTNVSKIDMPMRGLPIPGGSGRVKCTLCPKEFSHDKGFRWHYKIVHLNVRYKCTLCDKQCSSRSAMKIHHKSFHMGEKVQCQGCGKNYKTEETLGRHQKRKGCGTDNPPEPMPRTHFCDQCGKGFFNNCLLERHVKEVHLKIKEYVCEECGKAYGQMDKLKTHVKAVHLRLREHGCEICGKRFNGPRDVKRHRQEVHLKVKRIRNRKKKA